MRRSIKFVTIAALIALATTMLVSTTAKAQNQRVRATVASPVAEQALQSEYKGVRLGMTTNEARAKLGEPALKAEDQDYYVFSNTETATVAYDRTHKVVTISIDYQDGVGAPDYRTVVARTCRRERTALSIRWFDAKVGGSGSRTVARRPGPL